ncbi:hypothetical protein GGR57DRAFT_147814 [Xylariaceae sp. FL1272]|nr:hypothetical protein GGR57DRAFT_147814 [Xylariaceae sp. FL1272]
MQFIALLTLLSLSTGTAAAAVGHKTPRTALSSSPSSSPSSHPVISSVFPTPTTMTIPPCGNSSHTTHNSNHTSTQPQGSKTYSRKPKPIITPAPMGGQFHQAGVEGMKEKSFHITTFWSCHTFPHETHCGWHEPVVFDGPADAGDDAASTNGGLRSSEDGLLRAGVVAAVVGLFAFF